MEGVQETCVLSILSTILLNFRLPVEVKLFGNLFGEEKSEVQTDKEEERSRKIQNFV